MHHHQIRQLFYLQKANQFNALSVQSLAMLHTIAKSLLQLPREDRTCYLKMHQTSTTEKWASTKRQNQNSAALQAQASPATVEGSSSSNSPNIRSDSRDDQRLYSICLHLHGY